MVVTTRPNELVARIHDRMPAILRPEDVSLWLDPESRPETVRKALEPYPTDRMQSWPVSSRVNRPANDDPSLIAPDEPVPEE